MARNLENSKSENSNIQKLGPQQSTTTTRLHHGNHLSGYHSSHPCRGPWHHHHGASHAIQGPRHQDNDQAMSLQAQREPNALPSLAQASHPRVPHAEQPTLVAQPAPTKQPTFVVQPTPAEQLTLVALPAPAEQPTPVAQPTFAEQPTQVAQPAPAAHPALVAFQAAQIDLRLVQLSWLQIYGPMIEPGAFSPHFSTDLTFPNSNLAPGVYHHFTA